MGACSLCYLKSVLQMLYQDGNFRRSLIKVEESSSVFIPFKTMLGMLMNKKRIRPPAIFPQCIYSNSFICEHMQSPFRYILKSVVIHIKKTIKGGRYYCYAKYPEGWFRCNDTSIETVTLAHIVVRTSWPIHEKIQNKIYQCCDHTCQVGLGGGI